jgi:hypothetical protein
LVAHAGKSSVELTGHQVGPGTHLLTSGSALQDRIYFEEHRGFHHASGGAKQVSRLAPAKVHLAASGLIRILNSLSRGTKNRAPFGLLSSSYRRMRALSNFPKRWTRGRSFQPCAQLAGLGPWQAARHRNRAPLLEPRAASLVGHPEVPERSRRTLRADVINRLPKIAGIDYRRSAVVMDLRCPF